MAAKELKPVSGQPLEGRLSALRGRMAVSRALEDLQQGIAWGAGAALAVGLGRFLFAEPYTPWQALAAATCVTLAFPAVGILRRRITARSVAVAADERLGLDERVATALALSCNEAHATPLAPLVDEDARRSLDGVDAASLRRAFRPRLKERPLFAAAVVAVLAVAGFRMEPLKAEILVEEDPVALAREKAEKEDAARAARRVRDEARKIEETAEPKQAALKAVAAEMRRRSEEMLRKRPKRTEAIAQFQKMGELSRERMEMLAGVDMDRLKEMKEAGKLDMPDEDLERLLKKLLGARLDDLANDLEALQSALKGLEGSEEFSQSDLLALKERLDELADVLEQNEFVIEGRPGLMEGQKVLADAEMLRELGRRMSRLMETMKEQGWEAARQQQNGDLYDGLQPEMSDPIEISKEQLQQMIDRMKEMQRMADLGRLSFCQGCGMTGGT